MNLIEKIEITHHQLTLDPPFPASWDSQPRRKFPVTLVRVFDNQGNIGIGSGDAMYGFSDYQHYFLGRDALDLERHNKVLSNIEFHAGRPYPMDVALWDLAGKIQQQPVWQLVGGRSNRIRAYASSGVHRSPADMVKMAEHVLERGFPALKVRFGRPKLEDDFAVLQAIRDALGMELELMVDCNQGWRMPWDTAQPWNLDKAIEVAERLERLNVYWVEEPLHRGDYNGYTALKKSVGIKIAGGEMTREPYEFRELLQRDCLDVFQPDCVCTMGITGLKKLAFELEQHGKIFTPHTWGNGIGLMANLHLTAGTVGAPFIEFPYDPPEWSLERRDYSLQNPIDIDEQGWITLSDAPGLGIELNQTILEQSQTGQATFS
jgi:L-alanine-DL-glutamate epimerase-like enolase superfamily enzyme